jgi:hypothetical protein
MHSALRTGILLACSAAAVLLASSCSGPAVTRSDIVGTWVPTRESQQWLAAADGSRCQAVFLANGRFSATVPEGMTKGLYIHPSKLSAREGEWSLIRERRQGTFVELHFSAAGEEIEGYKRLRVRAKRGGLELSDDVNDPDSGRRFVFRRAPGEVRDRDSDRTGGH